MFPHDLIYEGGTLCLWLAAGFSGVQGVMGWGVGPTNRLTWQCCTRGVAFFQALFALIAWMILAYSHVTLDFSFVTVLTHVSRHLSPLYRLGATWTSPEGSMLLWCTMLSLWGALFAGLRSPSSRTAKTLSLIGLLNFSFWGLLLGWFDPFVTLAHQASDGLGLNPLLHDVSLMIHPLFLYGGYTSLVIPFCLSLSQNSGAVSASSDKRMTWLLIPWILLTAGLLTGSIWAYYELGWGGWWFWDPVENIALLPWLVVTAVLHIQKLDRLHPLVSFLMVLAFLFVLSGTTCIRAGLFTSIHSFAPLPSRTTPLLCLTLFWTLPSLIYAIYQLGHSTWMSSLLRDIPQGRFVPVLFLLSVTLIVACGTFLPLGFGQTLHLEETFYNQTLLILMVGPFMLMPFISLRYQNIAWWRLVMFTGVALGGSALCLSVPSFKALLCLGLSLWVGIGSLPLLRHKSLWPQALAHIGVALCLAGVSLASFWKTEIEKPLRIGESYPLGIYTLTFQDIQRQSSPLFECEQARLEISSPFSTPFWLQPERRLYHPQNLLTTETAILTRPHRDIYVVLGDFVGDQKWLIRATIYPGLWGLWGGGFFMISAGGLLLWRRRKSSLHRPKGFCFL